MNSNRAEKPKTFYVRHNLFFTLLGSFLILTTFVAKDVLNENLKDLASTISKATDTFVLRRDTALSLNITTPGLMTSASPGTQEELTSYILIHDRQSKAIIGITLDLAKFLDKSQREDAETKGNRFLEGIAQLEVDLENVKGSSKTSRTPAEVDSETRNLVHQSNMANTSAYDLMTTVIKEAETLKEDRESSYRIGVRVSYFLFVIGWALTFYGQLSRLPIQVTNDKGRCRVPSARCAGLRLRPAGACDGLRWPVEAGHGAISLYTHSIICLQQYSMIRLYTHDIISL